MADTGLELNPDELNTLLQSPVATSTPTPMPGDVPGKHFTDITIGDDPEPEIPTTHIEVSPSDVITAPMDDPEIIKTALRLGIGPDKKPIYNAQAIPQFTRWKAQLLFDDPAEKRAFLQQELGPDYIVGPAPQNSKNPGNFAIRRKDGKYWGILDPKNDNVKELLKEGAENIDMFAQAAGVSTGIFAGALAAGSIQSIRQSVKQMVLPEANYDLDAVVLDAATGGFANGVAKVVSKAGNAAKAGATQAIKAGQTVAQQNPGMISKVLNFTRQPKHIAQEIGASKRTINEIEQNISYIQQQHPDVAEALNKVTLKGKLEAVQGELENASKQLEGIYSNPNSRVTNAEIFNSPKFRELDNAVNTGKLKQGNSTVLADEASQKQMKAARYSFLEQLGKLTLEQNGPSPYMKAFRARKLHKVAAMKPFGFKTNEEALMAIIGQESHSLADLRFIKNELQQSIRWGKRTAKDIPAVSSARKLALDALDDTMINTVRAIGGEDLAATNKLVHNLIPIRDTLDGAVRGTKATKPNFLRDIPGTLNGLTRGSLMLARNAMNRTEIRSLMRGGLPNNLTKLLPQNQAGKLGQFGAGALRQTVRGIGFLEENNFAKHNFLPRKVDNYFENPDNINQLAEMYGDDEMTDALVRQYERGDKDNFSNTLSMIASAHAEEFEPAPYNSLVQGEDGVPVIMDKYEREQYRERINKTITDPKERYKALQALNGKNEMIVEPFTPPKMPIPKENNSTVTSRVASALKEADTVELDDGSERLDYDY